MSTEMLEWLGRDPITGHNRTTPMTPNRAILNLIDRTERDGLLIDRLFTEIGHLEQQIAELRKLVVAKK